MITRKMLLAAVALSLAAHIVVLALAGLRGGGGGTDAGENLLTVTLERRLGGIAAKAGEGERTAPDPLEEVRERARGALVDTVDLDRADTKYYPYLLRVKERIDRRWRYPGDAFTRGEEGTTVIEFSIEQEGSLADCRAVISSGSEALDAESLRAVRSAAPFEPLSEQFGLARLTVVAKFRYALGE